MPEQCGEGKASNYLSFDFGTKRIGVAVGSRLLSQARPLAPLLARDGIPDWSQVEKLFQEWLPTAFVIGLPLNMDGTENEMCQRARKFAKRLHGRFHRPFHMMDERLSSHEAKGIVIAAGGSRNFGENSVDGLAACLILETWFNAQAEKTGNEIGGKSDINVGETGD